MALYQDVWVQLKESEPSIEFYRFEGAKTCSKLDLSSGNHDEYVYISKSLDHHMYFTIRRLKQMINSSLLESDNIPFVSRTLRDDTVYPKVKNLIINGDSIDSLYSYRLICPRSFGLLLKDNCFNNSNLKDGKRVIERADRRVYGGGYGLSLEWRDLLTYLTYFTASTRINRRDILDIIIKMKTSGKMTYKNHLADIVTDIDRYQFKMNPHIMSDFNKYNIINALDNILEKGLIRDGSLFSENPRKVIRDLVNEYESGREKSFKILEKKINLQGE